MWGIPQRPTGTIDAALGRAADRVRRAVVPEGANWLYPCDPVVEIDRPADSVPNYLPGENPFVREFADKYHLPRAAVLGGAETMYPEYRKQFKNVPTPAKAAK